MRYGGCTPPGATPRCSTSGVPGSTTAVRCDELPDRRCQVGFAGNRAARVCVLPGMSDDHTDLELAEMHAEGVPCPDDDHARQYYALLDWLDEQLRAQRDL